jgi:hypothetical protein
MVVCLFVIPLFGLILEPFSIALHTWLSLSHPLALGLSHCICGQLLNLMGIHFLCCTHGGQMMTSHDVVHDAFVLIMRDASFHILCEQTNVILPPTF